MRVELPLAVPAIIGGLRIAVVSTISIATIAAFLMPRGARLPDLLRALGAAPVQDRDLRGRARSPSASRSPATRRSSSLRRAARPLGAAGRRVIARRPVPTRHVPRRAPLHRRQRGPPRPARRSSSSSSRAPRSGVALAVALPLGILLGHLHRGSVLRDRRLDRRARAAEPRPDRRLPDRARDRLPEQHGRAGGARERPDPDERLRRRRRRRPRRRRGGARRWACAGCQLLARVELPLGAPLLLHRRPHRRGDRRRHRDRSRPSTAAAGSAT